MIVVFEGMDNCLKDTLIQSLRGFLAPATQVLKFSGPPREQPNQREFQLLHFSDMFELLLLSLSNGQRNFILNRAHLGEYVYSPIYRHYEAEWIFNLEEKFLIESEKISKTFLILLYDSDNDELRRREDGKSLSKKADKFYDLEREKFIEAYNKSRIGAKIKFDLSDYRYPSDKKQFGGKTINSDLILSEIRTALDI